MSGCGYRASFDKTVGEAGGSDGHCQITSAVIPHTESERFRVSSVVDCGV